MVKNIKSAYLQGFICFLIMKYYGRLYVINRTSNPQVGGSNPSGRASNTKGFQLSLETFFASNWVIVPKIVPNCDSRYASCLCAASFKSSSLTILYLSKTDLVL